MGLMKKLTSAVVASSLVLGLFGTALAAPTAEQANAAYERLNYYGIAEGILREDGTKDPALDENLTRAQMVTLLVKAFGQKEYADMLAGAQTFSDVSTDHWATGYIAIAMNLAAKHGNTIGYPDGTFGPENKVTAIEALGFVLKFLGVKVSGGENWVENMIAAAKDAGVITDADVELYLSEPNEPATRGLAFALADAIFYNYNGLEGGKSVYTKLDTVAPVVTLDSVATTTEKASITISGKVSGDYREVFVGSEKVTVAEDGSFSAQVALNVGANTIVVSAKDWAGNIGTASVDITRNPGAAAKIQITAPEGGVVAGSTIDLPVAVVDAQGADTGVTDFKVDAGEAGTWADGKLTAGTKAGKYTITASYEGLEPASIEIEIVPGPIANVVGATKSVAPGTAVKLIAVDQYGNKVEGATFAEAEDYAKAFVEGDQFIATEAGTYKIVATKGEETAEGTISVFGEHAGFDIAIESDLIANNTKQKVTVTAVDKDGNAVTDFKGTVTLETNFADAVSKDAENGVVVFEMTIDEGMAGLEAEFTAKYQKDEESDPIEATEAFEVKAQVGTALELKGDKFLAINGGAFTGSVRILDQVGKELIAGDEYEITLTITGPAYFADTTDKEMTIELSGGEAEFSLDKVDVYTEGDVTVTATAEGLTSATLNVKAVYALTAKDLVVDPISTSAKKAAKSEAYEFRIKLADKNGVPVKSEVDIPLTIEFDSDKADQLFVTAYVEDATTPILGVDNKKAEDGKVSLTFPKDKAYIKVQVRAEKLTGDVKFTVAEKSDDVELGKASGTVSFKAGDAKKLAFDKTQLKVLSNVENTLTVSVTDNAGNAVAKSGVEVTVSVKEDAYKSYVKLGSKTGAEYKAKTNDEGKITVPVTLLPYLNNGAKVTLEASAKDLVEDEVPVEVVPSVAKSISVTTYTYSETGGWARTSSFDAGDVVFVQAVVTDNNGITVKDDSFLGRLSLGGLKLTEIGDGEDEDDEELPEFVWGEDGAIDIEDPDGGSTDVTKTFAPVEAYVTAFTARKAGSFSITVSDSSAATKVERSRGISVKAGNPVGLGYNEDDFTFTAGKPSKVVLNVVDAYGNKVSTSAVKNYKVGNTDVEFVGKQFKVYVVKPDFDPNNNYADQIVGVVRASETGRDYRDGYVVTIRQSVANYTIYVVVDDDVEEAELFIEEVTEEVTP